MLHPRKDTCMANNGERNGNSLQYSCLENPMVRGAWWAAVHRVAQSRTRLKQLSMHACIGEGNGNPLQYSCLENPLTDRESWQATVYRVEKSRTLLKQLCTQRPKTLFSCVSPSPVRVEHEVGTAAWLVRTLAAPNVQEHGLPPPQDLWRYQSLFEPLVAGHQKASMASLSPRLCPFRHLEGFLGWGPSLLLRCIRHIEEPPELGSYSIEGHVRHLMGHPGWGPTL